MEVLLFGIAKDIVGKTLYELDDVTDNPKSVLELKQYMVAQFPEFGKLSSLAIAVNSEYAADDVSLKQGDEIAIIPPVSGG